MGSKGWSASNGGAAGKTEGWEIWFDAEDSVVSLLLELLLDPPAAITPRKRPVPMAPHPPKYGSLPLCCRPSSHRRPG